MDTREIDKFFSFMNIGVTALIAVWVIDTDETIISCMPSAILAFIFGLKYAYNNHKHKQQENNQWERRDQRSS